MFLSVYTLLKVTVFCIAFTRGNDNRRFAMKLKSILMFSFLLILSFCLNAQNRSFAFVTDIHISDVESTQEDLWNTINSINSNPDIDFVIVGGDITEGGDRKSLEKAKSILDQLNVKYYSTSGNHETKWSESGVTDFDNVFGSDRFEFSADSLFFIGFNSGPVLRMMDGHVGKQDITWLKQKLDSVGLNRPVIVVTHYPLQDGDVDNWYQLTDLLRHYNVKAILNGHYHSNKALRYDDIPGIVNRSNLRANDTEGGYTIYKLENDSMYVYEKIISQEPRLWTCLSLKDKYYDKDNSSYSRPNYDINLDYSMVDDTWQTHIDGAIYASPIVFQNKVYVGDYLGNMYCISLENGQVLWVFKTGNQIFGNVTVSKKGSVVFGSTDCRIYSLEAKTGELNWVYNTSGPILGGATIDGNTVFVGGRDGIYALDVQSGREKWNYSETSGYIETRPLVVDNKVIYGAWDSYLYALDKKDGHLIWKWNNGKTQMHFSPAAVWPVTANGKVFFSAPDRYLTALDIHTGQPVWRTKDSMVRETVEISEDKQRIYSKTMQDSIVCYSANSATPLKLWSCNVGYGYDHAASMPQEKDGNVFGSTKNGIIFSVNGKTGELQWKHKIGNSLINTVAPINATECVYTSAEGIIGRLSIK